MDYLVTLWENKMDEDQYGNDQKYILIDLHKEIVGILKRIDLKLEFLCSKDKNDYNSFVMQKKIIEEIDLDNTALSEQPTNHADKDEYR